MKDKILTFVIGFLVGAVITAGGFLIYLNVSQKNQPVNQPNNMRNFGEQRKMDGKQQMNDGNMPEIPDMLDMPNEQFKENENNNQNMKTEKKKEKTTITTNENNV